MRTMVSLLLLCFYGFLVLFLVGCSSGVAVERVLRCRDKETGKFVECPEWAE